MMTDEDGYGGVPGWCVDPACGYPGELLIHHHHIFNHDDVKLAQLVRARDC